MRSIQQATDAKVNNQTAGLFFQPKLNINQPGDVYEQEADAMADKVMRMPAPKPAEKLFFKPAPIHAVQPKHGDAEKEEEQKKEEENKTDEVLQRQPIADLPIQRKCQHCEEEEEEKKKISRKEATGNSGFATGSVEQALQSPGQQMDGGTLNFMESRFGQDFGNVQIHNDAQANRSSSDINALAYTHQNHVVFGSGQYNPGTDAGKHLLAHELTHVVQQQGSVQRTIQRAPKPQEETLTQTYGEDFVIFEQELGNEAAGGLYPGMLDKGYVKIEILNLPPEKADLFKPAMIKPVVVPNSDGKFDREGLPIIEDVAPEQDPLPDPLKPKNKDKAIVLKVTRRIDIHTNRGLEAHVVLSAQTTLTKQFVITKNTPREMVEQMFNHPFGNASISILFNHKFPGDEYADSADPVHDQQVTSLNDIIRKHAPDLVGYNFTAQQQYDAAIKLLLAYVPHSAIALDDPKAKKEGKEFKTLEDAQKEAAKMGKKDVMIVQTPDGRFLLYELTQADIFRITTDLRFNEDAEGDKSSVDWRALPDKVKIEKLIIGGKEVSVDELKQNAYYVDADASATGSRKNETEAIIYRMNNSGFFARKPITHDEAMALWRDIDDKVEFPDGISKAYSLPEGRFVSLHVKGVGSFHTIDSDYIEGKRIYMQNVSEYDKDVKRVTPDGEEYTPLTYDIYKGRGGDKLLNFITANLDRGSAHDDMFRDTTKGKSNLQSSLTLVVLTKLDNEARTLAMDILTKVTDALKALTNSDEALRNLIISLSKMSSKDRKDMLTLMGVQEDRRDVYTTILSDATVCSQIAFGIPVKTISFQVLRSGMQTVLTDTGKVIQEIKSGNLPPLRIEGDFGRIIRDKVYKDNGFTHITGSNFPHHDQVDKFLPNPLDGNAANFSGMMEQVYANFVASSDHAALIMKIGTIGIMAIITAAIIIFSGGIGTGVAAAFFEAGTAAFVGTEIVVTAAAMTVLTEGLNQAIGQGALGKDKPYFGFGDLAMQFGENLALTGIFAGVGRIMKNVAAVWRLTATATLFLGYSFGRYYVKNKKLPQGRELYLFIYENLISLAAIEAGGVLSRPLTQMFYAKGLDVRVAEINKKIADLKTDIIAAQKKLADMVAVDKIEEAAGLKLIDEQKGLLERQKQILLELKNSKTLSVDIDVNAELQKVEEAIQKIKVSEFQRKIDFKQDQLSSNKVSYKPGAESINAIVDFYGKDNVTGPDDKGVIDVKLPDGSKMTFYPEGQEAAAATGGKTGTGTAAPEPAIVKPDKLSRVTDQALKRIVDLGVSITDLNKILKNAAGVSAGEEVIFDLLRVMELAKKVSLSNFDKLVTGLGSSDPVAFRTARHMLDDAASYVSSSTVGGVDFKYSGLEKGDRLLGKFSLGELNTLMNMRWSDGFVNTLYDLTTMMPDATNAEIIDLGKKAQTGGKSNLGRVKDIVDALKKPKVTYDEAVKAIEASNAFGADVNKAMKDPKTGFGALVKLIWGDIAVVEGENIKVKDKLASGSDAIKQATGLGKADKLAEGILSGSKVDNAKWEVFKKAINNTDIPQVIKNNIIGDMWARVNIKAFQRQGYTVLTEVSLVSGKTEARADAVLIRGNEIIFIEFKSGDASYTDGQEVVYPLLEQGKFKDVKIKDNEPLAAKYADPTFSIKFRPVREADAVPVK